MTRIGAFVSRRVARVLSRVTAFRQITRQHGAQQVFHLESGGNVRHRRSRSKCDFVDIVDGGQSARIELPEDHPLRQPVDDAELQLLRELLHRRADETLVA